MSQLTRSELDAYSKADAIVQEVFSSVRTVFSHNAQESDLKRYVYKYMPRTFKSNNYHD